MTEKKINGATIQSSISNEELDLLPLSMFEGKIHLVQSVEQITAAVDYLKKQLGRLGETPFALTEVTAWDETKMIPASVLNELRRDAVAKLTETILDDYQRPAAGTAVFRSL